MNRSAILRRLEELEQELEELRKALAGAGEGTSPGREGTPPIRALNKGELQDTVGRAFREMGVRAHPIGAEEVQRRLLAYGVNPEENAFSRELLALRGECPPLLSS